jgi:glyoxylate/hydroxypyruvate reductase A
MADTRLIGLSVASDEISDWTAELEKAAAVSGLPLRVDPSANPADIDYLVYNIDGGLTEFSAFPNLRVILNTWAGVEAVVGKVTWPDHVPFCRMAETGMTDGMSEYFVGHTMRYLLDIDRSVAQSQSGTWEKYTPRLARQTTVGVLGLGVLGSVTAAKLTALGFNVLGWSRSQKELAGVSCHAGPGGLDHVLSQAEILILILPSTPETANILNADTLARLPESACIINAGRGPLIDDDALLAALASGHVRHATLDVFRIEPLPGDHPYWRHPQVTVTPHIAAETRFDTAAEALVEQIGRDIEGKPLLHIVDRASGY